MQDFRKLRVWSDAHELTKDGYQVTTAFPKAERFGLTSQIRRAAVSVPSNIVEGTGRRSPADFRHFLDIAAASSSEVQYRAMLARELGWLPDSDYDTIHKKAVAVRMQLHTLANAVDRNSPNCRNR